MSRELIDRIDRLERRQRWMTGGLAAVGLAVLAAAGIAQADAAASAADLTVRSLTVVDAAGVPRVRIAAPVPPPIVMGKVRPRGGDVSGIILFDAKGNERSGYVTSDDKAYPNVLFTLDSERHQRVLFIAEPDGATTLRLFKDKANMAEMTLYDDRPGLRLVREGKTVFEAPTKADR